MKTLSLLAALVAATSLSAQETADTQEARLMLFVDLVRPMTLTVGSGVTDQPGNQIGGGLRFMGQVRPASRWFYELAGRPETSSNFSNIPSIGADFSQVKVTYSYFSLGGGYLLPLSKNVDLGFHMEARSENVRVQGNYTYTAGPQPNVNAGNTFLRPWVRLSLDCNFAMGDARPILGADIALGCLRTYQTQITPLSQIDDRTARALAPQAAASAYIGLKF